MKCIIVLESRVNSKNPDYKKYQSTIGGIRESYTLLFLAYPTKLYIQQQNTDLSDITDIKHIYLGPVNYSCCVLMKCHQ